MATRASQSESPEISLIEAKHLFDSNKRVAFVDVRTRFAYDEAHIRSAESLPLDYIDYQWDAFSPDQELILYGDSPDDASAAQAAAFLRSKGFTRVRILRDGFEGWQEAGYPIGQEQLPEEALEIHSQFSEPPH